MVERCDRVFIAVSLVSRRSAMAERHFALRMRQQPGFTVEFLRRLRRVAPAIATIHRAPVHPRPRAARARHRLRNDRKPARGQMRATVRALPRPHAGPVGLFRGPAHHDGPRSAWSPPPDHPQAREDPRVWKRDPVERAGSNCRSPGSDRHITSPRVETRPRFWRTSCLSASPAHGW